MALLVDVYKKFMTYIRLQDIHSKIPQLRMFCAFSIFSLTIPFFLWSNSYASDNELIFVLRFVACSLCFLVLILDYLKLTINLRALHAILAYFTILYCLPFLSSFLFFYYYQSSVWQINLGLSLMLMVVLLNWLNFLILTLVGNFFGILLYQLLLGSQISSHIAKQEAYISLYLYGFSLLIGVVLAKNKNLIERQLIARLDQLLAKRTYALSVSTEGLLRVNDELKDTNRLLVEANEELDNKNILLEEIIKAKRRFLENISNEVRTPIYGLITLAQTLEEEWESFSDQKKRQVGLMLKSTAQRLEEIVNNIFQLSKIETDKFQLEIAEFDIIELIREIMTQFLGSLSRLSKKPKFKLEVEKHFDSKILGDYNKIKNIFYNLISSSLKYSSSKRSFIRIKLCKHQGYLLAKLNIDGYDISHEQLDLLFKPFTYSSDLSSDARAKGLGLVLARELVFLHNGQIWHEHNNQNGVCIYMFLHVQKLENKIKLALPLKNKIIDIIKNANFQEVKLAPDSSDEDLIVPSAKSYAARAKVVFSNYVGQIIQKFDSENDQILIVDDDESARSICTLILKNLGYKVLVASSGKQGLEILSDKINRVRVVLLDIMMPDMLGTSLLKKIKSSEANKDVIVVMQSGLQDSQEVEKVLKSGAFAYLYKPYSASDLKAVIKLIS